MFMASQAPQLTSVRVSFEHCSTEKSIPSSVLILIDYDNVEERTRRLGVEHVARKVVALADVSGATLRRVRARLYGGWYEGGRLTRRGQQLSTDIRSCTPIRIARSDGSIVLVDVELAVSILAAPRTTITNTLRTKGYPRGIQCDSRPWQSCFAPSACPMAAVHDFIQSGVCTNPSCSIQPSSILTRMEQKVVDTMMVTDLIFSAQTGEDWITLVTRDDDIWPGLFIAAGHAHRISHISTSSATRTPPYYSALPTPPYHPIFWT